MHIFFAVLLWILLALFALVLFVLFVPVGVSVRVNYDKPTVWLRVLFFKFKLYPQKEKKPKKQSNKKQEPPQARQPSAEKAQEATAENTESTKPPQSTNADEKPSHKKLNLSIEKLFSILSSAGGAMKIIFKGLFFTKIEIIYPVHAEDSAETAINYGKTQAYFGSIAATAQNFVHLSFKRVQIIPDFNNEHKFKRYFYCNIWSVTFIMLVAAVYLFISLRREKII